MNVKTLALLAAVVGLCLAGCSSGGDDSSSNAPTVTNATVEGDANAPKVGPGAGGTTTGGAGGSPAAGTSPGIEAPR